MTDLSLIPYLNPTGSGGAFSLEFAPNPGEVHAGSGARFPFEMISGKGSWSRIFSARVVSDAGSPLKEIFLMLSRDDYAVLENAPVRLTNTDVELIWKKTFLAHNKAGSLIALSDQGRGAGGNAPFRSLFYCSKTRLFFHPPCPECGHELSLCRDDAFLGKSGLVPYSSSLKRYLACPSCMSAGGEPVFYAWSPDAADPEIVKGPDELITGFGNIESGEFPCARCPEHAACYSRGKVLSLITPIAFYPFYLLAFEAAPLNASDYISLVSGVPRAELEKELLDKGLVSRSRSVGLCGENSASMYLFEPGDRRFLEILLLKLSFLREVSRRVLSDDADSSGPGFGLSLEDLWLKVPGQGGLLPPLWGSAPAVTDMDLEDVAADQGLAHACHVLGKLWFRTLLRNRSQDPAAIDEGIASMIDEERLDFSNAVFGPHNISWEPTDAPRQWAVLWEKSLALGAELLLRAGDPDFSREEFFDYCMTLDGEIRKELFNGIPAAADVPAAQTEAPQDEGAADEQIGLILGRIRKRWTLAADAQKKAGPAGAEPKAARDAAADVEATVVLAAAGKPSALHAGDDQSGTVVMKHAIPEQGQAVPEDDGDFKTETVIMYDVPEITPAGKSAPVPESGSADQTVVINQAAFLETGEEKEPDRKLGHVDPEATVVIGPAGPGIPGQIPAAPAQKSEDAADATVILGPAGQGAAPQQMKKPQPQGDLAEETVILGTGTPVTPPSRSGEPPVSDDALSQTVILGSAASGAKAVQQPGKAGHDDDSLSETVIMGSAAPGARIKQEPKQVARDEDGMSETVIMGSVSSGTQVRQQMKEVSRDDGLSETVIMGSAPGSPQTPRPSAPAGHEDSLSQTVIMGSAAPEKRVKQEPKQGSPDDDGFSETVIMGTAAPRARAVQQPEQTNSDGLSETVIMGPAGRSAPASNPVKSQAQDDEDGLSATIIMKPDKK